MTSKRLFPEVTHISIDRLLRKSPFLDLSYVFNVDLELVLEGVKRIKPTVKKGTDFDAFKRTFLASRTTIAKSLIFDSEVNDLDLYAEYVLLMHRSAFSGDVLVTYYEALAANAKRSIERGDRGFFLSSNEISAALQPVLKWARSELITKEHSLRIVKVLESVVYKLSDLLLRPSLDADLLEAQNAWIFICLVVGESLQVVVHQPVTSGHLLAFRKASSSSWEAISLKLRIQYATLVLYLILQHYPSDTRFETKVGFSEKTLADFRAVMADASGTSVEDPLEIHQWVFRWFKDKVDVELFSTRRHFGHAANLSCLSEGELLTVIELSRRFASYRTSVTAQHIRQFLLQFGTTPRIRGALRLLMHLKFFPLWELAEIMERLLESKLPQRRKAKLVVVPLGDQTGSTAIIRYLASHSKLSKRLVFADDIASALKVTKKGDELHFVDDCLMSGTQTLSFLGDLTGTRDHKPHHTIYTKSLSKPDIQALRERKLVFSYCIATDLGQNRFLENIEASGIARDQVAIQCGVLEHSSSKAFAPLGPVRWDSAEQRDELKEFATETGYSILGQRAALKNWPDARRKESALGFSDFQRLIIFPYNVPKTTLPILWERGSREHPWMPLFPGAD